MADSTALIADSNCKKADFSQDRFSLFILFILYTIQGIPRGLCSALPMVFKSLGASYESLSLFSLVSLPFSLKILWAPLVDSWYFPAVGRRKTWLVPVQVLTGAVMIWGSYRIDEWIHNPIGVEMNKLTLFFGGLYFLAATQDIAVDGWALTLLSRENAGYASAANSMGNALGIFIANQSYLTLADPSWCHRYLGLREGQVMFTLEAFVFFWGWVFIAVTIYVVIFKSERKTDPSEEPDGVIETFRQIWMVCRIRTVLFLCCILLTCRMAFGASEAAFNFKLQEYGVQVSDLATVSSFLMIVKFVLPVLFTSIVSTRSVEVMLTGYTLKLFTSLLRWVVVQLARERFGTAVGLDEAFFVPLVVTLLLNDIADVMMSLGFMTFFSHVADPSIGGTYLTLLNTVANIGRLWPTSVALWMLPKLDMSLCLLSIPGTETSEFVELDCSHCTLKGGKCLERWDGFTVELAVTSVIGLLWLILFKQSIYKLQSKDHSEWLAL